MLINVPSQDTTSEPWPSVSEINYLIDHDWDKLWQIATLQEVLWAKSFTAQRHSQKAKAIAKVVERKRSKRGNR